MKANCVLCWCPADTPGSVLRYSFRNMWSMWLFQQKLLTLWCKTAWVQLCLCISWLIDIVIDVCYLIWWYLLHLITHYGLLWLKCFLVVRVQPCLMGGVWQPQAWPYLFLSSPVGCPFPFYFRKSEGGAETLSEMQHSWVDCAHESINQTCKILSPSLIRLLTNLENLLYRVLWLLYYLATD